MDHYHRRRRCRPRTDLASSVPSLFEDGSGELDGAAIVVRRGEERVTPVPSAAGGDREGREPREVAGGSIDHVSRRSTTPPPLGPSRRPPPLPLDPRRQKRRRRGGA
jgi:hypothetical protein